jgi:hypothetical protein
MFDENYYNTEDNEAINTKNDKKVEEKGGGVGHKSPIKLGEIVDEILANLENTMDRKLTNKQRRILSNIAACNYYKKGVTKEFLMSNFDFSTDYAEKIIFNLKKTHLIVPSGIRKGHKMTYFLSNMQDYIPLEKLQANNTNKISSSQEDLDQNIILLLFKELSNNKGLFHNFRLITKLIDKSDYELFDITSKGLWKLQSIENKVKVTGFRLPNFRTVTLQVSPNGTVEIFIESSRNPYDLKHDMGLSEFFVDIGKIEAVFELELKYGSPLEHFYNWHIVGVDYNYDIEGLELRYLSNATNILQVKHLSHLYQFYTKQLPHKGLVLRLEEHFAYSKPYPTLKEFINGTKVQQHDVKRSNNIE